MSENFKIGDVLAVKRKGGLYYHYGVYVGNDKVVHFSADDGSGKNETDPSNADIRETYLKDFAKDDEVSVDTSEPPSFSGEEIAKRAESLIGTQKGNYDIALNNCEHFAKFCKTGHKISTQVDNVKALVPVGDKILGAWNDVNEIKKAFQEQKVDIKKVQHSFGKKTVELLSTYNSQSYDAESETDETESVKKWSMGLSLSEKDYEEINKEIDINDNLKVDYDEESKNEGFSPLDWFAKKIGKKLSREESVLACNEIQRASVNSFQNGLDMPEISGPSGLDILRVDTPENIRNSKVLLASGIKKAGSMLLCIEVPNDLATPIACGAVDIKKAIVDFAMHKNPVKLGTEVTKSVVVSGAQFVKNSFKHPLFYAKSMISVASPVFKRMGASVARVPEVKKVSGDAGKVLSKCGNVVSHAGNLVKTGIKAVGKTFNLFA